VEIDENFERSALFDNSPRSRSYERACSRGDGVGESYRFANVMKERYRTLSFPSGKFATTRRDTTRIAPFGKPLNVSLSEAGARADRRPTLVSERRADGDKKEFHARRIAAKTQRKDSGDTFRIVRT